MDSAHLRRAFCRRCCRVSTPRHLLAQLMRLWRQSAVNLQPIIMRLLLPQSHYDLYMPLQVTALLQAGTAGAALEVSPLPLPDPATRKPAHPATRFSLSFEYCLEAVRWQASLIVVAVLHHL